MGSRLLLLLMLLQAGEYHRSVTLPIPPQASPHPGTASPLAVSFACFTAGTSGVVWPSKKKEALLNSFWLYSEGPSSCPLCFPAGLHSWGCINMRHFLFG